MKKFKIYKDRDEDRYVMVTTEEIVGRDTIVSVNYHQGVHHPNGDEAVDFDALNIHDPLITSMYKAILENDNSLNPPEIITKILHGILDH